MNGPDPERPRRLLEEVLARREFQTEAAPPDWLERLLHRLGAAAGAPDWLAGLVLALFLAAALALFVFLLTDGFGRGRPRLRRPEAAGGSTAEAPDALSAGELLARGAIARTEGRWAEAVILTFRALLADLVERGLLLDDAARTNREHLRDLERGRPESAALAAAVPTFERVLYGRRPATAEDAAHLAETVARVRGAEGGAP